MTCLPSASRPPSTPCTRERHHAAPALKRWCVVACLTAWAQANAAPVTYTVDPDHTFPSFEADHMGLSVWRGKINKTSGTIVYDKATGTGTVDITIDPDSIDFGHKQLNNWARSEQFLHTGEFPVARYVGRLDAPRNGVPTRVLGDLTLRGATRPVVLDIAWIRCIVHPLFKREVCGADASGSFNRDEFG
ncbi:MAG: hypothetical protein RL375_1650, partial [Pseudomonadota bacterium]